MVIIKYIIVINPLDVRKRLMILFGKDVGTSFFVGDYM